MAWLKMVLVLVFVTVAKGEYLGPIISPCGETLNDTDYQVTIKASQVSKTCVVYLVRLNGKETTMELQASNIKPNTSVMVCEGNYTTANTSKCTTLKTYRGKKIVDDILISTSKVTSLVYTVAENETGGLTMVYTTKGCLREVDSQFGRIRAPIYLPGNGEISCTYNVTWTQPGIKRIVAFNSFNLPHGSLDTDMPGELKINLTGTTLPDDIFFETDTYVLMNLLIENNTKIQGFDAILSQGNADCTQKASVNLTKMDSLQLPDGQTHPIDCRYILTAPAGTKIVANMLYLTLTGADDSITFQDGGSQNSRLIARFDSSPSKEKVIVSSGNRLWIRVKLDESVGIRILDVFVWQQAVGGGYYGKSKGNVTLDAKNVKANNTLYYQIGVPSGQVELNFNKVVMDKGVIQVLDGQADSPILATFKKMSDIFTVTGSGSQLMLYVDGFLKTKQSFSASYKTAVPGCDKLSTGNDSLNTMVTSQQGTCTWNIKAKSSSVKGIINLNVRSLSLCPNDTLTIYDGLPSNSRKVASFISGLQYSSLPSIYVHNQKGARLVLESQGNCGNTSSSTVQGAYVFNPQECGRVLNMNNGFVFSPQYPNQYPLNAHCKWNFMPSNQSLLYVSVISLQMNPNHTLGLDYSNGTKISLRNFVNQDAVFALKKASNLVLDFDSRNLKAAGKGIGSTGQGFQLKYKFLTCGGYLQKAGAIKSPKTTNETKECIWVVKFPKQTKKNTTNIVTFNITIGKKSPSDMLTIYDGSSMSAKPFNITTGKKSKMFFSRTNTIIVRYLHTSLKSDNMMAPPYSFNVSFKTYMCNKLCQNGHCLLASWKCNGVNDCGDNTDELNCTVPVPYVTTTTKPSPSHGGNAKGVKSYVVVIVALLCICIGIGLALAVPALYKRWKYPNYSHLSDLNVST